MNIEHADPRPRLFLQTKSMKKQISDGSAPRPTILLHTSPIIEDLTLRQRLDFFKPLGGI